MKHSDNGPIVSVSRLIEALPEALILVDEDGVIYLVNQQTEWLLGYPREEIIGKRVEMLLPPRLREAHVKHRAAFANEPSVRDMSNKLPLMAVRKNGDEIQVTVSLSPLVTASGMFILAIIRRRSEAE